MYIYVGEGVKCWNVTLVEPDTAHKWRSLGSFKTKEEAVEFAYKVTSAPVGIEMTQAELERKTESKLSPVLEKVVSQVPPKKSVSLGVRNKRIKDLWAAGKTRREIADTMNVSYQVVYSVTGPDKNGGNNPDKKKSSERR